MYIFTSFVIILHVYWDQYNDIFKYKVNSNGALGIVKALKFITVGHIKLNPNRVAIEIIVHYFPYLVMNFTSKLIFSTAQGVYLSNRISQFNESSPKNLNSCID